MLSGIRVSESDYVRLKQGAESVGISFAEHCRQLLTNGKAVNSDKLSDIRLELNKIGVNINQIAHRANAQGYDSEMYDSVISEIAELRRKYAAISI
jgi:hypothetical protein